MKSIAKISADIEAAELKLASLKSDLKAAQKAEAEAERNAVFAKMKASGLSLADLESIIASRQSVSE